MKIIINETNTMKYQKVEICIVSVYVTEGFIITNRHSSNMVFYRTLAGQIWNRA